MQKSKPVFVSQKGTGLTPNEKKSIINSFSSSIPLKERTFFANMVESLSLQGLPPAGDGYFGKTLNCSDGRPFWDDISTKRHGGRMFTHKGARTAIESLSLGYMASTKLYEKKQAIDLNLMIASHYSGKHGNAAFSIRYEFVQGKTRFAGALFVSGGSRFNEAVVEANNAFVGRYGGDAFVSIADNKSQAVL